MVPATPEELERRLDGVLDGFPRMLTREVAE
jgi:hypothetical protein